MAKANIVIEPKASELNQSIDACLANADRLIDDVMQVEFQEPPATKLMLAMIAQEESAKAFILFLVREGIVPWSCELLRAMNDHACKQLVSIVLDYADPQWTEPSELERLFDEEYSRDGKLPFNVASALNIFRHEKIGRWEANNWIWSEDPEYDKGVVKIAEGKRDKIKQDALYVRLGADARVVSTPGATSPEAADQELERAQQYKSFVRSIVDRGWHQTIFHRKI